VTPFDPAALLAMLLAFYPAPSPAAFAQARGERPEYFAGGVIVGSKGDKLQLGDGRVFDCIYAAGGLPSEMRWQVIDVTNDAGGTDAGLALTPGPLAVLDPTLAIAPFGDPGFEAFVAGELDALGGSDGQLDRAGAAVLEFDGGAALEDSASRLLDPAEAAHANIRAALDADDPIDELGAAADAGGVPDVEGAQYVEQPPPDVPPIDPGDPPDGKGGDGGTNPPEA
jgi:hypothetical protein